MNAEHNQVPSDLLEQATAALREAAPAGAPPAALVATTIAALESRESAPTVVIRAKRASLDIESSATAAWR